MHILHVLDLSKLGGVEVMFLDLLRAMAVQTGVKHTVAPIRMAPWAARELRALGVECLGPFEPSHGLGELAAAARIRKSALRLRPDVVYGHGYSGMIYGAFACLGTRLPLVVHEHGSAWNASKAPRILLRWGLAVSDRVLCNSRAASKVLQTRFGVTQSYVVHNGVDLDRIRSARAPASLVSLLDETRPTHVVLFVGSLKPMKGVHLLPAIARCVLNELPETLFLVVGEGRLDSALRVAISSDGLQDRVRIVGRALDVGAYMARCDVLMLPSVREPFGNVLVEAAAVSRPAVAAQVDGVGEVVEDGQTGVLVRPADRLRAIDWRGFVVPRMVIDPRDGQPQEPRQVNAREFADALVRLLKDDGTRRRLGENARIRAEQCFAVARYAQAVQRHLENACASVRSA